MARELPEFAGGHIDSGYLNIYLTDLAAEARARPVVQRELSRQRRALPVRFRKADYAFSQLEAAIDTITPHLGAPGIAYLRLFEQYNRLYIGVVTEDARARVETAISRLGVPRGIFVVEWEQYAIPVGKAAVDSVSREP
jgi:hypothetical protein